MTGARYRLVLPKRARQCQTCLIHCGGWAPRRAAVPTTLGVNSSPSERARSTMCGPRLVRVESVGSRPEARVELNSAAESASHRFDVGIREAGIEDDRLHVGVEPHRAMHVGFDALVEVVESGGVGQAAQVRQYVGVADVGRLMHRVGEAERCTSHCSVMASTRAAAVET